MFDKAVIKFLTPLVAILMVMICIYLSIEILNHIWLELLLLLVIFGVIASVVAVVWFRFRRW